MRWMFSKAGVPGDSPGGRGCELRGVKPAGVTGSLTTWSLRMGGDQGGESR